MTLGRIGGLLVVGGAVVLLLGVPVFAGQGGPGLGLSGSSGLVVGVSLALFGCGAAVLSFDGPRPLHTRLVRIGLGALAVGQLSVTAFAIGDAASPSNALESLPLSLLLIVGIGAFVLGWVMSGVALVRMPGPPRAVGALLVGGLLLYGLQLVLSSAEIELPGEASLVALALVVLGNAGIGALALPGDRSATAVSA